MIVRTEPDGLTWLPSVSERTLSWPAKRKLRKPASRAALFAPRVCSGLVAFSQYCGRLALLGSSTPEATSISANVRTISAMLSFARRFVRPSYLVSVHKR